MIENKPKLNKTHRFWIVNHVDRPYPRLVAELRSDGYLHYIHPDLIKWPPMDLQEGVSTPLEDFGIAIEAMADGSIRGRKTGVSTATYFDGWTPRQWQGDCEFILQKPPKETTT